jgi:centrosomal protein CEP290
MIIQLRKYESGEYGLAEAVSEIKELRHQRRVRDRQIEELVQASNKLQAEASQLEEQNMALRYVFVCLFVQFLCG